MLLHDFIQSMSKAEKRYFKLYAQIGKKSIPKYVNLFDLINKQKTYDEQAIKKKGFNSDDKNLLIEKLLDAAHVMQLHKSVDNELRLFHDYFLILDKKKHWQLLGKYIKRAKQLAKENEQFDILLGILKWEQHLVYKTVKTDFGKRASELVEEKRKVLAQLRDELQYYDLCMFVDAVLLRDAKLKKPETQAEFNRLISSPLLHEDTTPLSNKAMVDYYYIKSLCHSLKKEYEKTYQYYKLILELFDNNTFLFRLTEYGNFYVKIYFWAKALGKKLNKKEHKSLQINNLSHQFVEFNTLQHSLIYCIRTLNFEEGEQLIAQAKQKWKRYNKQVKETRLMNFSYTIMTFYYLFEDWENTQIWLDRVTAIHRVTDRKDIQIAARLWQLIVGYELAPYDLDKYIQAAYKYFVRNDYYFEVEQQILKLFRGLRKAVTYDEKKVIWQEMVDYIDEKCKEEKQLQRGLFSLQIWCKSKISRISNVQIIQQDQKDGIFMIDM